MSRFQMQLLRQLGFLQRSGESFDAGYEDEGVRIATVLRTLFHDTRRMTSVLQHLGAKDEVRLASTVLKHTPDPREVYHGVPIGFSPLGVKPALGHTGIIDELSWTDWSTQVLFAPRPGMSLTRQDLFLVAADKDGGSHVDSKLTPEYLALMAGYAVCTDGTPPREITDVPLVGLRQLGYEVTHSPDLWWLAEGNSLPMPTSFLGVLGARFAESGANDAASYVLHRLVREAPTSVGAHRDLGLVLNKMHDYMHAKDHLREAVKQDPEDVVGHIGLGLALTRGVPEPHRSSDEARALFLEAERSLKLGASLRPNDPEPYSTLAACLCFLGRAAEGVAACELGMRLGDDSDEIIRWLAECLCDLGEYERARAILDDHLTRSPTNVLLRYIRARAFIALQQMDDAIADIEVVARAEPAVLYRVLNEPFFKPIATHPRTAALVKEHLQTQTTFLTVGRELFDASRHD